MAFAFAFAALLSTTAFASADGARPPHPGVRLDGALRLTIPREFVDPAFEKFGLELEPASVRSAELERARAYSRYRRSERAASRARFAAACAPRPSDPYCAMESARLAALAIASGSERARKPVEKAAILSELRAGDFAALKARPLSHVAIAASTYDSFDEMKPAALAAARQDGCDSGEAALILAGKAEEFFPEKEAIESALALYSKASGCSSPSGAAKARYRHAMIAIWQNRCPEAETSLEALDASQAGYAFRSRARYWRLHCARATGRSDLAEAMQNALMQDHPLSFHNLAVNGGDASFIERISSSEMPRAAMRTAIRPEANLALRAIEALIMVGDAPLAGEAADLLSGQLAALEPEARLYLSALMARAHQGLAQFRILAQLFQERPKWIGPETLKLYFPLWYFDEMKKRAGDVDPLLFLSLIRQESGFNARAMSNVGARGLMQLMPGTARSFAAVGKNRLFDPLINMTVGTKFFRRSLDRFSGDVELTLAGYNAGAERAAKWARRYTTDNRVLFLDLIPFKETRDYVSAILRNYYWYNELYGEGRLLKREGRGDIAGAPPKREASSIGPKGEGGAEAARVASLDGAAKGEAVPWPSAKTRAILGASARATLASAAESSAPGK